ncbi:hypothetical protein CEXT_752301 [Caerostris extrusa]|uniref:Uncharacterized protein n=1 Tax=Caerostris extrusa TaxID=172846 RepID=A0AAV4QKR3_CAEEX|nr:hypothetical protein CEXT_752301 [Caerostris extrusa]
MATINNRLKNQQQLKVWVIFHNQIKKKEKRGVLSEQHSHTDDHPIPKEKQQSNDISKPCPSNLNVGHAKLSKFCPSESHGMNPFLKRYESVVQVALPHRRPPIAKEKQQSNDISRTVRV